MSSIPEPVPLAPSSSTSHTAPSTYMLRKRASRLGISTTDFDACRTIGDLQVLAKRHYRNLARHYHPDARAQQPRQGDGKLRHLTQGAPLTGAFFRALTDTYTAIMEADPTALVHRRPKAARIHWRPGEDTHALQPLPVREAELPWAMERKPIACGFGWHETYL